MSPGERDSREDVTGQLTSEGSEIGWLLLHEVKREWRGEKDFYFRRWQFRAWWLMCEFNFRRVFSLRLEKQLWRKTKEGNILWL